jgi:broad specificity phosphatase PhoE/2'-5' RNA ligase
MPVASLEDISEDQQQAPAQSSAPRVAKLSDIQEEAPRVAKLSDIEEASQPAVPGTEKLGLPAAGAPPVVKMEDQGLASTLGSVAKDTWDAAKKVVTTPAIPAALNQIVPEKYRQQPTSFAQIYQENKDTVEDLLKRTFGDAYHKGMSDNKSIALLQSISDAVGKSAADFLDFLQTPAGVASAVAAGASNPLVQGAAKAIFSGSMAPKAIASVSEFVKHPSVETAGPAIVDPLLAASPMAQEISGGLHKIAPEIVDALDVHNAEAARLLEQERQAGQVRQSAMDAGEGFTPAGKAGAAKSFEFDTDDGPMTVKMAAKTAAGRELWQVVNEKGAVSPIGTADDVTQFLQARSARPAEAAAEPTPISPRGAAQIQELVRRGVIDQAEADEITSGKRSPATVEPQKPGIDPADLNALVEKGAITQEQADFVLDHQHELDRLGEAREFVKKSARLARATSTTPLAEPVTGVEEENYVPQPQVPPDALARRDAALQSAADQHSAAVEDATERRSVSKESYQEALKRPERRGEPETPGVHESIDPDIKAKLDDKLEAAVKKANAAFEKEVGPDVIKQIKAREDYVNALRKRAAASQRDLIAIPEEFAEEPTTPKAGQPQAASAPKDANAPRPPKATVPEEGIPERVARVQDARQNLAQELTGKPWSDLNNPDRLVIDHFVSEGRGFSAQPEVKINQGVPNAATNGQDQRVQQPGEVRPGQGVPAGAPATAPQQPAAVRGLPQQSAGAPGGSQPQPVAGNQGGNRAGSVRRVTGSADIPLSDEGRQQVQDLVKNTVVKPFDRVATSPEIRALETAMAFKERPEVVPAYDARRSGELEGRVADAVKRQLRDLMLHPNREAPGFSPHSGEKGESYFQFTKPLLEMVQRAQDDLKPGERELVVTHGGNLQAINEWAKDGFRKDFTFNRDTIANQPYWSATGQMFRLEKDGLKPVANNEQPGLYFVEHASTKWNPPAPRAAKPKQPAEQAATAPKPNVAKLSDIEGNKEAIVNGRRAIVQEDGKPLMYLDEAPSEPVRKPEERPVVRQEDNAPLAYKEGAETPQPITAHEFVAVKEGTPKEVLGNVAGGLHPIEELRDRAKPVLDTKREPTGWDQINLENGALLVHPHDARVISFEANNEKSGTDLRRARAEAQAYAVDNPVEAKPTKAPEQGNLVVKPLYPKKEAEPEEEEKRSFASTQFNLPNGIAKLIQAYGKKIPDSVLAEDGRETEPHVTIRWGLHSDSPRPAQVLLKDAAPVTVKFGKTSVFDTPDADVLKIDIESPDLHALNKKLAEAEHTDTHPTYVPHVTIAYLAKGEGAKYAGQSIPGVTGVSLKLSTVKFSPAEGEPTQIPLNAKAGENNEHLPRDTNEGRNRVRGDIRKPAEGQPSTPKLKSVEPTGKSAQVQTTKGTKVNVKYDVREAGDITNSFESGFPQEYQPRDTSRKGSRQRVDQRKADMTGALMADSRLASDGAPITLDDGVAITRNHGTQALKELYAQGSPRAKDYKKWITEHAEEFGLDPTKIAAMKQPMLVRVITDKMKPEAIAEFAKEANAPSTARMSDAEVAVSIADRMSGSIMDTFDPTEDGRPNIEFVREIIKGLPVEEQATFMDRDGNLSQSGNRIIRQAVFAKAYPDPRALERMSESESPTLKNLTAGMLAAAPKVAQLQESVARGDRFDLGIGPEIADAASTMDEMVRTGMTLDHWLNQGAMFGRDPAVEALVKIFSENRRSSKRIGDFLKEYTGVADAAGSPKQETMFGPPEAPEKIDVIEAAYERAKERWSPQRDIFAEAGAEPQSGQVASRKGEAAGSSEEHEPRLSRELDEKNNLDLFGDNVETEAQKQAQSYEDKLLGQRLTAQLKSGMAAKPSKLKPKQTVNMFEDEGPTQDTLFSREVPGFYSQMERTLEDKLPNKVAPQQVMGILSNPQSGVKPDEVKWSGIGEWLKEQKKPYVTKHEVLDFVRANNVKLTEVQKGKENAPPPMTWEAETEDGHKMYGSHGGVNLYVIHVDRDETYRVVAHQGHPRGDEVLGSFESLDEAKKEAQQFEDEAASKESGPNEGDTKYGQYTTPGGSNYREVLLTLPTQRDKFKWTDAEYSEVQKLAAKIRGDHGQVATEADRARFEELRDRQKAANTMDYKDPHWEEKNILGWGRVDDRTGPNGEKILHVGEIQSGWGQEGRKKGYKEDFEKALTPEEKELRDFNARTYQGASAALSDAELKRAAELQKKVGVSLQEKANKYRGTVPSMPFPKTWHEVIFKRLLRYASEHGYDAISWDTGETQADRYDLSKQVREINYTKQESSGKEPTYNLAAVGNDGSVPLREDNIPISRVEDLVGKDIAKKIEAGEGRPMQSSSREGLRSLTGIDLKVGGEGQRGFYDQILPAFANKYAKKWNAKVGKTALLGKNRPHIVISYANGVDEKDGFDVVDAPSDVLGTFATEAEAIKFEDGLREKIPAHYLPITNEMRSSVMQGQPLFMQGAPQGWGTVEGTKQPQPQARFRNGVLWVNSEAMKQVTAALGRNYGVPRGMFIPAGRAAMLKSAIGTELKQAAQAMPDGPAVVVRMDAGESISRVKANVRHEMFHATEKWGGDQRAQQLMTNDLARRAADNLGYMGYDKTSGPLMFSEIGAHLASGPQGWSVMGLNRDEAKSLFQHYLELLDDATVSKLSQIAPQLKQELYVERRIRASESQFADVGRLSGGANENAVRGAEVGPVRRSVREDVPQGRPKYEELVKSTKDQIAEKDWDTDGRPIYYHGSKANFDNFQVSKDGGIHLGNVEQAVMRNSHRIVAVDVRAENPKRVRDDGGNWKTKIAQAKREGHDSIVYLNRYEGIGLNTVFSIPSATLDKLSDREFRKKVPEAGDSMIVFSPSQIRVLGHIDPANNEDVRRSIEPSEEESGPERHRRLTKELERIVAEETGAPEASSRVERNVDRPGELPEDLARKYEHGFATVTALSLGLDKFIDEDVTPTVKEAAETLAKTHDDIMRTLAPQNRGAAAKKAALTFRTRLGEYARSLNVAQTAVAKASHMFAKKGDEFGKEFILKYFGDEMAPLPQFGDPHLDSIAKTIRGMLDQFRDEVQQLGTGKLKGFYENYFGRVWKDSRKADAVMAQFFGKRPLEGPKAFLKKRKYPSWQDGLDAGLEPISWNPIDLMMMKIGEMARYTMAHRVLNDWKESGLAKFVDARSDQKLYGWKKIDDAIGVVYGRSIQTIAEYPNEGLHNGLMAVANALGLKTQRGFLKGMGNAVGRASQSGTVKTLHGTAEQVLAHEIGHQIDWLAGSGDRFLKYGSPQIAADIKNANTVLKDPNSTPYQRKAARDTRKNYLNPIERQKTFKKELIALADLRSGRPEYTHKREEKMALLAEMWVGARDLFEKTAPEVYKEWKRFLDENPKLHALRDIQAGADVTAIGQPYDVGGLVIKGYWYAPAQAAQIMNNYLSPGLRQYGGYKFLLGLNNVLNQWQLGFSAFHVGFTSIEATTSKVSLAIEQALRGSLITAAKTVAGAPLAPFTSFLQGDKVMKAWNTPGSQGAVIGKIADAVMIAGGRARMDEIYATAIRKKMMHAFRNGNIWGGLARVPFAAMETLSDIIMREIVPRQKLGAFADQAAWEMQRLGPNATTDQVAQALQDAWDSIDNRFGQMVYDNLFWNKFPKDLLMIAVRSVAWNYGTIREVGFGAADIVKVPTQILLNKFNISGGKPPKEVNIKRLSYVLALAIVNAVAAALYMYLHTGKWPQEFKDYVFPKNGQLDEHGNDQRSALPTYVKDVYHYKQDPFGTVLNKTSPIINLSAEMWNNKRFYEGTKVYNEGDPFWKQVLDEAKDPILAMESFSARNIMRAHELGESPEMQAENFFGIIGAPSLFDQSGAQLLARKLVQERLPKEGKTQAEADRARAKAQITRLAQQGNAYTDKAAEFIDSGVLTPKDVHAAAKNAEVSPLIREFKMLGIEDAVRVWEAATSEERDELRPLLVKKAATLKNLPPEIRNNLEPKVMDALNQ